MNKEFVIPSDIPQKVIDTFKENYKAITKDTGRLILFAGDQKIEHLNYDFYGPNIHPDDQQPEHLFSIASQSEIGAFATQLGLIARYGKKHNTINYMVKLNAKTNLVKTKQKDPISDQLWSVQQVVDFKKNSQLNIRGIGYTIYLGSEFEHEMLSQAAQAIYEAHQHGLITLLWMYPRGKSIKNEHDAELIAGAAGIANALGADFAKINPPKRTKAKSSAELLIIATQAAGNTKLICSGGKAIAPKDFLTELYEQIHIGGMSGNATGRNIHQRSLPNAIQFSKAIAAIVLENKTVDETLNKLA